MPAAVLRILAGAIAFALLGACGGRKLEGPPTIPVKGKVEFTKGGNVQELANREIAVEFQSVEQPDTKAFGAILDDGTFEMTTQVAGKGKPGAIAGTHRVRLSADESGARFVSPKLLRFETSGITVKVPPEGELVIKVSK